MFFKSKNLKLNKVLNHLISGNTRFSKNPSRAFTCTQDQFSPYQRDGGRAHQWRSFNNLSVDTLCQRPVVRKMDKSLSGG